MSDFIYLDNHSASKPFSEVLDVLTRSYKEYWGPISSPHFIGQQQIYPLQKSIENIAKTLGAEQEDELFFSSGSAEGRYHAFFNTYLQVTRESGKTLFLTTQIEENSSISSLNQMETLGCVVKFVPLNDKGQVTKENLIASITPKSAIFSISWANGLTGVIHPISDLAAVCEEQGILFHVDASYLIGKSFFRFQDLGVHFLTVDGSVIHASQDTGFTFVRKGVPVSSFIPGKDSLSIASASALSCATLEMQEKFEHYCMEIARLRDLLEKGLSDNIQEVIVLFKAADRVPNCSAISFPGVHAEALLYLLNSQGVYATIGGGKFQLLEKTLLSIGVLPEVARSALSFALSWDTTEEEIRRTIEIVVSCVNQLKNIAKGVFL